MIRDHFPRRRQKVPWSTLVLLIILLFLLLWMKLDYHRRGSFYKFFTGGEAARRAVYLPPDSLRLRPPPAAAESAAAMAAKPAPVPAAGRAPGGRGWLVQNPDGSWSFVPGTGAAAGKAAGVQGRLVHNADGTWSFVPEAGGKTPGRKGALVRNPDGTWSFVPEADSAAGSNAPQTPSARHGTLVRNPDGTWSFVPDADSAAAGRPGHKGTMIRNPDGTWSFAPDADSAAASGGTDARRALGLRQNPDGSWTFPGDSLPPPERAPAAPESSAAAAGPALSRKAKPPVVEAYPGGGLFARKVDVKLQANGACTVYYSFNDSLHPQVYREPFRITRDTLLYFWGVDSAGNRSPVKKRWYDIGDSVRNPCPPNMVLIYREEVKFCIDRYEWPNREGKNPQGFFSFYQARDSCRLAGKYLCPAAAWQTACNSFNRSRYPYGDNYETTTCNTAGAGITASGSLPGCRTYFGVFDICGNLREWVDSPAPQNRRFFQVRGGSWESHQNSACGDFQYSYYPENRYTSIGFRCCQAAP